MDFFNKLNREFKLAKPASERVETDPTIKKEPSLEDFTDLLNKEAENRPEFGQNEIEQDIERLELRYRELSTKPEIVSYIGKMGQYIQAQEAIQDLTKRLEQAVSDTDSTITIDQIRKNEGRKQVFEQGMVSIERELAKMEDSFSDLSKDLAEMKALEEKISHLQQKLDAFYNQPQDQN